MKSATLILTIGHTTRSLDGLMGALRANSVNRLIDIRTIPRSRHNPQFNRQELTASLPPAGIAYEHRPGLGGLRQPLKDSPNGGWRNSSFRGFADYMQTAAFEEETGTLIDEARRDNVCRSGAVALPSLARRRCADHARRHRRAHRERRSSHTAQADPVRADRRAATYLPADRAGAVLSSFVAPWTSAARAPPLRLSNKATQGPAGARPISSGGSGTRDPHPAFAGMKLLVKEGRPAMNALSRLFPQPKVGPYAYDYAISARSRSRAWPRRSWLCGCCARVAPKAASRHCVRPARRSSAATRN